MSTAVKPCSEKVDPVWDPIRNAPGFQPLLAAKDLSGPKDMSNRPSFFTELRRRNVLRAAAFYAASAWLLVQVATQIFPFFQIANWLVRWVIVAAAIGFPFWVLFA